jgi:hypothetical protein
MTSISHNMQSKAQHMQAKHALEMASQQVYAVTCTAETSAASKASKHASHKPHAIHPTRRLSSMALIMHAACTKLSHNACKTCMTSNMHLHARNGACFHVRMHGSSSLAKHAESTAWHTKHLESASANVHNLRSLARTRLNALGTRRFSPGRHTLQQAPPQQQQPGTAAQMQPGTRGTQPASAVHLHLNHNPSRRCAKLCLCLAAAPSGTVLLMRHCQGHNFHTTNMCALTVHIKQRASCTPSLQLLWCCTAPRLAVSLAHTELSSARALPGHTGIRLTTSAAPLLHQPSFHQAHTR